MSTFVERDLFSSVDDFGGKVWTPLPTESKAPTTISGPATLHSLGVASIFIQATKLSLEANKTLFSILDAGESIPLDPIVPPEFNAARSGRYDFLFPIGRSTWASTGPIGGTLLNAEGLSKMEVHGISMSCNGCPNGSDRAIEMYRAGGATVESRALAFHEFTTSDGNLQLSATPSFIAFGGAAPDFFVDGHARLPEVEGISCAQCKAGEQTLSISGALEFHGLAINEGGRAVATLRGEFSGARIDEAPLAVENLGAARVAIATAATVGLLAAIKFLAIPLFTRLSKAEALEHPNRQRIYAYIQEHPGANFREVARMTGIASGTVRHHLTILERSGHIVEHPHQGTVRLFENHGKFDHNWSDVVLLREAPLAQVHAWLQVHPHSPQKDVLAAFEGLGWSRSTTQHRLARMVEGGVVAMRLQGRLKIYSPAARPAVRSVGLPSTAVGSLPG